MKNIFLLLIFIVFLFQNILARRVRTEQDEAKYLEDLKARELQQFEDEQRMQSEKRNSRYSSAAQNAQSGLISNGRAESTSYNLPPELRPRVEKTQKNAPRHEALVASDSNAAVDEFGDDENWCYACVTPIDHLKPQLRKSIRSLFDMRRTSFPHEYVTPECLSGRNLTALKKKKCSYKYCQSLSIIDRNSAASFVVRGCAENFGAIDPKVMESKEDYSCDMLHEKLEIKECICKNAKYCNAGWRKRSAASAVNLHMFFTAAQFIVFYWLYQ
ncbi:unnamed protein product [Caenorhabditis angaria]|uniref:Uncharacterized protein n=1 Tax=Caenorhabditis angaria TaxID=860376 RepID=A0A9P1J4C0_9PELO|nr:unnamed protein product [Caenorhabditis angaria]